MHLNRRSDGLEAASIASSFYYVIVWMEEVWHTEFVSAESVFNSVRSFLGIWHATGMCSRRRSSSLLFSFCWKCYFIQLF